MDRFILLWVNLVFAYSDSLRGQNMSVLRDGGIYQGDQSNGTM